MKIEKYEQLEKAVTAADMVLVGLGEEWVLTDEDIKADLEKKDIRLKVLIEVSEEKEIYANVKSVLTAYYYKNYMPDRFKMAYENLFQLIKDKNYFIVSLSIDSYLKKIGFKEDRFVNPCGTYEKLQCDEGCDELGFEERIFVSDSVLMAEIKRFLDELGAVELSERNNVQAILAKINDVLKSYSCGCCNSPLVFNYLGAKKYKEEGYLENWKIYMKWLQGTLNRKLCVIAAGVGMKLPSVIRWPFEKTVFYNQKSEMFRIHEKFYQVNEEVSDRAYGCKSNSVNLFCDKKLEAFE